MRTGPRHLGPARGYRSGHGRTGSRAGRRSASPTGITPIRSGPRHRNRCAAASVSSENWNKRCSFLTLLSSRGGIFSGDHFTPAYENPWISFAELSLFKDLRRPSGPKILSCPPAPDKLAFSMGYRRTRGPMLPPMRTAWAGVPCSPLSFVSTISVSGSSRSLEASEGLAPF